MTKLGSTPSSTEKEALPSIESPPSVGEMQVIQKVIETHADRFFRGLRLRSNVHDLLVTREDESVQLQAVVSSETAEGYAVFLDCEHVVCGCLDNLVRKLYCKHAIGSALAAYEQKLINGFELFLLLCR